MSGTRRSLIAGAAIGVCVALGAVCRQRGAGRDTPAASHLEADPVIPSTGVASPTRALPSLTAMVSAIASVPLDEVTLMARLRDERDARIAVELARDGDRRFLRSAAAAERASILIHALVNLGRQAEARGEAERVVNDYPDSVWVREIEQFTGAHRHRNIRLTEAGVLEYYDPQPTVDP